MNITTELLLIGKEPWSKVKGEDLQPRGRVFEFRRRILYGKKGIQNLNTLK